MTDPDDRVERVARAIYFAATPEGSRWEWVDPRYQETVWRAGARAAIAALSPDDAVTECPDCSMSRGRHTPECPFYRAPDDAVTEALHAALLRVGPLVAKAGTPGMIADVNAALAMRSAALPKDGK